METKTKSSKRIVLIIICSVLVAAILAFVLFYLSVHRKNRDATFFDSGLNFAEADYETDILSDPYYLRYDRHIMYTDTCRKWCICGCMYPAHIKWNQDHTE